MSEVVRLDEFKRIQLRTAKVLSVDEIGGADRLWKLTVDAGSGPKTIVAGIKAHYPQKESLVGRGIVIVDNLEPAVIRGVESCGMLLAVKAGGSLSILEVDSAFLPPGSPVD